MEIARITDRADRPGSSGFDPADAAMCARARRRYSGPRNSAHRRRLGRRATLPNLIVIGGLKCGTSSMHHYLGLHPEIQMSRPKELNFFVEEINWDLGIDWYASRFDRRFSVRGESSPHYTNLPRFDGVAERIARVSPDTKLIYMVRDPIERIRSHWAHSTGAGYETEDIAAKLARLDTAYVDRSRYWMQLQPFLRCFKRDRIAVYTREELRDDREGTMRSAFRFLGVDDTYVSVKFDREWERSGAKQGRKYQFLEGVFRAPGLRWVDGNFELLPEPVRWTIEKVVHEPGRPARQKAALPIELEEQLRECFGDDVARLQKFAGRRFAGWGRYV